MLVCRGGLREGSAPFGRGVPSTAPNRSLVTLAYVTRTARPAPGTTPESPAPGASRTPLVTHAAAPLPHRLADVPAVQRKIRTKAEARTYAAVAELGNVVPADEVKRRIEDQKTYLAQSKAQILAWTEDAKTPMLSPHRHLVGETHDASRFTSDVIPQWGWGATVVAEGLNMSHSVPDVHSPKVIGQREHALYGAKPLENLPAYTMNALSMAMWRLKVIQTYAGMARGAARGYVEASTSNDEPKKSQSKQNFEKATTRMKQQQADLGEWWEHHVDPALESFKVTATNALKVGEGDTELTKARHVFALAARAVWGRLAAGLKKAMTVPYSIFTSWNDTPGTLSTLIDDTDELWKDLNLLGTHVTKFAELDLAVEKLQGRVDPTQTWKTATEGTALTLKPLDATNPLREAFMAHHIDAAAVPALVRLGDEHVENLRGKITDGAYYKDYAAFAGALKT
jgi:hypothetical protein